MTPHLLLRAFPLLLILPLSGCIHSYEKVYKNPGRTKVSFDTEKAGRTFYETLSKLSSSKETTESKTGLHLILINVEKETVTGQNHIFNEAVARCDTNKDGEITEIEADLFALSH